MHDEPNSARCGPEIVVRSMGRRLRICVRGAASVAFLAAFRHAWGHLIDDPAGPTDRTLTVRADDPSPDGLAAAGEWASNVITVALIDLNAGGGTLFHAAAVLDANGTAALLVGPSGAGKTTAAVALGRCGYLTDETAFVKADGHVAAYPKPLSVKGDSPRKSQVPPADLGLPVPREPQWPVGRLIVLDREPGAVKGDPRSERLDLASAVLALMPEISQLAAVPRPLTALATLIASLGGAERLTYADVGDFDAGVLPGAPAASADSVRFSELDITSVETGAEGRGFVRTPADDAIQTSTALLVAHGSTVTALDGIAVSIWRETARERTRDDLLDALRGLHGRWPHDAAILDETLRRLVGMGVLRAPPDELSRESGDRADEKTLSKGPLG